MRITFARWTAVALLAMACAAGTACTPDPPDKEQPVEPQAAEADA